MHAENFVLAAEILKQAAKEVGDVYTNRREKTGKDGGPIQHTVRQQIIDEAKAKIIERFTPKGANQNTTGYVTKFPGNN